MAMRIRAGGDGVAVAGEAPARPAPAGHGTVSTVKTATFRTENHAAGSGRYTVD